MAPIFKAAKNRQKLRTGMKGFRARYGAKLRIIYDFLMRALIARKGGLNTINFVYTVFSARFIFFAYECSDHPRDTAENGA